MTLESDKSDKYITELCIAGASHRGIAYIGALRRLEELELLAYNKLKRVVGVSAGALVLFSYINGIDTNVFLEHIINCELSLFKDIELSSEPIGFLRGYNIRQWIIQMVIDFTKNENITMKQLYEKTGIDFIIGTVCLGSGIEYISHASHPDMKVYQALISSANIPIVFKPYEVDGKYYVDGALLDNFPIHLLDENAVGIHSSRNKMNGPMKTIDDLFSTINMYIDQLRNINQTKKYNIIEIQTNDTILNFDINLDDKITLYKKGYEAISNSEIIDKLIFKHKFTHVLNEILNDIL